jgi:hypothetical protein
LEIASLTFDIGDPARRSPESVAKSWPKPGEKNFRQVDGNPASKSAESRKLVLIPDGMTRKTPRECS